MRDKHYKIKGIRMSEETWKLIKNERKKVNLTWNLFLLELINKNERKNIKTKTIIKRSKNSTQKR